jgi:hypothetical protein
MNGKMCANAKAQATHDTAPTQDPAAYVPGTPTLGQYQPKSALRALSPHLSLLLRLYQQPLNQG